MPDPADKPKPIDLSGLQLKPDWVDQLGAAGPVRQPEVEEPARDRESREDRRPPRGRDSRPPRQGGPREPGRREPRRDGRKGGRDSRGRGRGDARGREARRPPENIPEGLDAEVVASDACLEALVSRIRASGRACGMFDLAKVVLEARDRFRVEFVRADPAKAPQLYRCGEAGGVWLDKRDAVRAYLRNGGLEETYRMEETQVAPPKGEFKSIAVCGMSGTLIGPPNHHSYQLEVVRLHQERFSNMPFEKFKARIRTETDEELVNRWREEQSKRIRYFYPREPAEGGSEVELDSMEAVERHFLRELSDALVQEVDRAAVPADIPGKQLAPELLALLRQRIDALQRNPFPLVKRLCSQVEKRGLKIFKRHGKKLFVSKTRPRALDPDVTLSGPVHEIVEVIRARPGIRVAELATQLAPRTEADQSLKEKELTSAETQVLTHLRWLIEEGFVIEYASTALFLGVQGGPKKEAPQPETAKPPEPSTATAQPDAEPEAAPSTQTTEANAPETTAEPAPEQTASAEPGAASSAEPRPAVAEAPVESSTAAGDPPPAAAQPDTEPEAAPSTRATEANAPEPREDLSLQPAAESASAERSRDDGDEPASPAGPEPESVDPKEEERA